MHLVFSQLSNYRDLEADKKEVRHANVTKVQASALIEAGASQTASQTAKQIEADRFPISGS